MKKRKVSEQELNTAFNDQLGSLQRSTRHFDDGYHTEARRIAVILRMLFHSKRDPSLLRRLGRENVEMLNTCPPFDPENILPFHGLAVLMFEDGAWSYAPRLDVSSTPSRIPLKDWWEGVIFSDSKNRALTRADVVLTAANQDGGAHVDGKIREDYAELHVENSLGWVDEQGKPPSGDVRYVAIRQMAHEVLKTFVPGYSKTLEDIHTSRRQAEISVGKMCFYPHQHRGFINNLADPLTPGTHYLAEIFIDSITTGSVYMVLNSAKSDYVNRPGRYQAIIQAGVDGGFGVFGEHTDAIVEKVSLRQIIMPH